jgi:hypothetical protein
MSGTVHIYIDKTKDNKRHIVAFSVGNKELTEMHAEYNSAKSASDLEYVELDLTAVNVKCNYTLTSLTLEMVDALRALAKKPATATA